MTSFAELWEESRAFRQLFLHNGIFPSVGKVDLGKAEALWWARFPRTDWTFCNQDGCIALVPIGEVCTKHIHITGSMPTWKWYKGILYCYMSRRLSIAGREDRAWEYRAYHTHQGEQVFGEIPDGYVAHVADGNPFNLARENMVLLSRVSLAAVKAGRLSIADAVEMDDVLGDFVARRCGRGRGPRRAQWVYNVESIAKAVGVRPAKVRRAISEGRLDPNSLASVVEFCQRYPRSDIV